MNLDAIKKKLESMQSKPTGGGANNQTKRFKPQIGKQTVRVVPFKYNKEFPFTEMKFYYGIGSKKVIASPLNWGEKDPIVEFAKQLRQTSDKENWRLAKKVEPKMRIFVPVIVHGEESEGVKLWQFGKELYMDFLNLADNEDVGDFTDVSIGRDITLTTVGPEVTGTNYNKTTIMPKVKETPLAASKDEVNALLENQPNPMEVFKRYSFEDMKAALQEWLTPEEPEEGSIIDDEKEVAEAPKTNYSINTSTAAVKQSKLDKFDSLFDDEESDDLPF